MRQQQHYNDADQATTSVDRPTWVAVTWVNPRLRGRIQREQHLSGRNVAGRAQEQPRASVRSGAGRPGGGTMNTTSRQLPGPAGAHLFSLKPPEASAAMPSREPRRGEGPMVTAGTSQSAAIIRCVTARFGSCALGGADRVHAAGDAFAREAGWSVRVASGRFGLGNRRYRDPWFGPVRADEAGQGLTGLDPRSVAVALRAGCTVAWQERCRVSPDFAGQRLARAGRSAGG